MKISACFIVRDGEDTFERALASVKPYVDEIVVGVDSRTVDDSRRIARKYSRNIFTLNWTDDFAAARNLCASHAHNDIILVLDADDVIEPGKRSVIEHAIRTDKGDGIRFIIQTSETTFAKSIRCYDRRTSKYVYRVHEYLHCSLPAPVVVDVPIVIAHHKGKIVEPGRNLKILDACIEEYPRYLFYHGRECYDNARYEDAILSFRRYLEISKWVSERSEAHIGIARSYVALGDFDNARPACLSCISEEPNFAPAHNLLGQCCSVEGKWEEAIKWYEASLSCEPIEYIFDCSTFIRHNNYGNLIIAYAKLGRQEDSEMAAQRAEEIIPGSQWVRNQIEVVRNT